MAPLDPMASTPPSPDRPCPVCGGRTHVFFASANGCDTFRCASCALVFVDPAPDAATIDALYADTYAGASESYFTKVPQKLRRSRHRMKRLRRQMEAAGGGRHFLDVGCNGGFMVEAAREAGFIATGLEPDGAAVAWARQHYPDNRFIHGLLEDADFGSQQFDAVYCSEVIEHAPDPNRFMAAMARVVRSGGLLYLTTPDIDHWRRPRDVTQWDAFCPPSHCLYFNRRNLTLLLARHGFVPVYRAVAFKPGLKMIARRDG